MTLLTVLVYIFMPFVWVTLYFGARNGFYNTDKHGWGGAAQKVLKWFDKRGKRRRPTSFWHWWHSDARQWWQTSRPNRVIWRWRGQQCTSALRRSTTNLIQWPSRSCLDANWYLYWDLQQWRHKCWYGVMYWRLIYRISQAIKAIKSPFFRRGLAMNLLFYVCRTTWYL